MNDTVVLEGDLSAVHLPDVLTFVSMIRRTGKLLVVNGDQQRVIWWHEGEITFATSNSNEHSLGQFLLRNGKISEEQYHESMRRVTPQLRHGKLLVQMGAISPKDLWWGVKHQVLEIIYSLFPWQEGHFEFHDTEEDIQERITLSINTSSIIMEGIRRLDEDAQISEKIPNLDLVFAKAPGAERDVHSLELSDEELALYGEVDGVRTIRELIPTTNMTDFEVRQILFRLLSARIIEEIPQERGIRPVFLDVEDSPELLKIISTYNDMFGRLYQALAQSVGEEEGREIFTGALQSSDSNELWVGVFFDQFGRFDENMLIANISELPFERRKSVLDEGLNTLLSIQLFEVSQHLNPMTKVEVFRYISDQKAQIEKVGMM
ncbi:MAG: DUF4388 domain-containing protein [Thermoanaerobaculia bacterium]